MTNGVAVPVAEMLAVVVTFATVYPDATAAGFAVVKAGIAFAVAVATRAAGTVKVTTDSPASPHAWQLCTTVAIGISGWVWESHPQSSTVSVEQYSRTTRLAGFVEQTVV
jgi:hypothetical protein